MKRKALLFAVVWTVVVAGWVSPASGQTAMAMVLGSTEQPPDAAVENVNLQDGTVTGEVVNRSGNTLKQVRVLIRYYWQWKNDVRPGKDNLSFSAYHDLPGEVPPNGRLPFTYQSPNPLPARRDGYFRIFSDVATYTRSVSQTVQAPAAPPPGEAGTGMP